ncbi:antibiotic biosynthesis monooxygenase [Nostoc sp. CENA67]|uniref:Antibiotic biosynthesis monooxygenase n=1 Tax=Amazonocrinis nigriterrae CENA67 TaxID=2794033 RepID=A0A8J7L9B1_9NOST|nr:antibiotic biosynthesis monooxygenase [Amazonocrinis nigriterrae]MBH8562801.1 antibiotic biosynthesis monooxygenase [Amazonocrinis nigriterrae CENA67]
MRRNNCLYMLVGLAVSFSTLALPAFAQFNPVVAQQNRSSTQSKTVVARIWHGKTLTTKAAEYYNYLNEAGIKKIQAIPGNLGVQVLRRTDGKITEFTVISYWESRDAIRAFAGNDIEKVRFLPKDHEYLIEPETKVKHFDVLLDDRK